MTHRPPKTWTIWWCEDHASAWWGHAACGCTVRRVRYVRATETKKKRRKQ